MSHPIIERGTRVTATATHATAATATVSGTAGKTIYISVAAASSDKAGAIMLVKDGTTVIWQEQVPANEHVEVYFDPPLAVTPGADATVTIDSTAAGKANILGVQC